MPHSISPDALAEEIRRLQLDRRMHASAIGAIDAALEQINQTLLSVRQATGSSDERNATGNPAPSTGLTAETAVGSARPKTYRKFSRTGEQAILDLVRERSSATTAQINKHWRAEGRRGLANNAIGRLLKDGHLVRESIAGQRGSSYRLSTPVQSSNVARTQQNNPLPIRRDVPKMAAMSFYPLDADTAGYPSPPNEDLDYPSHGESRL